MKRQLTKILDLPGVLVKEQKTCENTLILEVELQDKAARCPNCCKISHRLHQNHYFLVKDIPWGEKEIILKVNRRQFKCNNCQKPFSEQLEFVGSRKKYTHRYAKFITEQVVNSDLLSGEHPIFVSA
ncbi:transposase family protein [Gloeothece verrucosa]|uniref:transposase family protein n=1 Tax=Gloeothece verrucosa TaxID=2546359 RepID=UPI0002DC7B3C|nr:transposase family protein [Gloeothece verrucosa]